MNFRLLQFGIHLKNFSLRVDPNTTRRLEELTNNSLRPSVFIVYFQASVIHQDFVRFVHVDDQQMLENNLKLVPSPPEQVRKIV